MAKKNTFRVILGTDNRIHMLDGIKVIGTRRGTLSKDPLTIKSKAGLTKAFTPLGGKV